MERAIQLIVTIELDDDDDRTPEEVRREIQAELAMLGAEVTLPG